VDALLDRAGGLCLNETMQAAVDNLRAICTVLAAHGVRDMVSLDLTEIHNLGYYTGITFEVLAHGVGYRLASGGRYDHLVGSFGAPQPAVGAAFGLERLLLALDEGSARTPAPVPADVLVAGGGDPACIELVNRARGAGLHVVVDLQGRRGDALWQLAQHQRISCAVDYGETILLWMGPGEAGTAGETGGASVGECTREVLWQQLQRLALAKAARAEGFDAAGGETFGAYPNRISKEVRS
jgi:ATP phosphoribosyltransferase regulatory subunit